MSPLKKQLLYLLSIVLLLVYSPMLCAQQQRDTTVTGIKPDSSQLLKQHADSIDKDKFKERIRQRFKDSVNYESDTVVALLLMKIEQITELINYSNSISERGFDTAEISAGLPEIEELINLITTRYLAPGSVHNLRSLRVTKGLLIQNVMRLEKWQEKLFNYSGDLATINTKLTEILRDSIFRKIPKDSVLQELYIGQLSELAIRWKETNNTNNTNLLRIGLLQNRIAGSLMKANDMLDNANELINASIKDIWVPEEPSIFSLTDTTYPDTFGTVAADSLKAFFLLILFYMKTDARTWIICALLIGALFFINRISIRKIKRTDTNAKIVLGNAIMLVKQNLLSSAGIVLVMLMFTYVNMPPSWSTLLWFIIYIIYSVLTGNKLYNNGRTFWLVFTGLFFAIIALNLMLYSSVAERWMLLLLNVACAGLGIYSLRKIRLDKEAFPYYARFVVFVFTTLFILAIIANIMGSYMLAKSLNLGGISSIAGAVIFYTTMQLLLQFIFLHQEAWKENKLASYLNFQNIHQSLEQLLQLAAKIAWLVILARNLNIFDFFYEGIRNFLTSERTIGGNVFTFGSVLIFLAVIWLSSFISKIILVIFGESKQAIPGKKNRWSSYLILVRLAILSLGFIIAFAAAGIPMDNLAIIIGALGVGIGFGLQNIVNNLVSGIILAFEKPIQIGDAIEVGNRYGIVKEIGIRSSKLLTVEGSEVIVPNGDMLSQHIINWTLSNHYRRVELVVGVSYDTDLRLTEKLLNDILRNQEGIEKYPASSVLAHQFGESSIDFRLLFWCHIDSWVNVKSEILIKVHEAFSEHGIQIPYPQRDIHIIEKNQAETATEKDSIK